MPTYLACLRAHVPKWLACYVLTCKDALRAYVLTCQRALRAYVLTCQRASSAYVLTCQWTLRAHVLMCKCAILSNINSYIIHISYLYLDLKRGNKGETPVSLLEIFALSSVAFRSLGGLKRFGEKKPWENVQCTLV